MKNRILHPQKAIKSLRKKQYEASPDVVLSPSRASTYEESRHQTLSEDVSLYGDRSSPKEPYEIHQKPTALWYLAPLLFGLIGGLIGYVGVKDRDQRMADGILTIGFIVTVLSVIGAWAYWSWVSSLFSGW